MPAPDRYLVLRPGLGTSLTDLAVGGTSDWLQVDDRDIPTSDATVDPDTGEYPVGDGVYLNHSTAIADPPAPDEPPGETPEFAKLVAETMGGTSGLSGGGYTFFHNTWHTVTGTYPGDDDPFYLSHGLIGSRTASATSIIPDVSMLHWNDDWRPEWPEGAIGYEVSVVELAPGFWAPASEPIAAHLTLSLETTVDGGSIPGLSAYAVLNKRWGTGPLTWRYNSAIDLSMTVHSTAAPTILNAEDHELGLVWADCNFEGELTPPVKETFVVTDFSHAPPHSGLLGLHWSAGKLPSASEANPIPTGWDEGFAIEVDVHAEVVRDESHYTIRPPRFRWIYPGHPYRRITQRGDALAGGACRIGGRVKTIQGSNRRGAGSIV